MNQPPPDGIDPTTPSAARLYDYYVGGKDHYAVDREAAESLYQRIPELKTMALANRLFLVRVVDFLTGECGITQFIDLGSGLPTADNTHQVAHRHNPAARVVYVDYDPMVNVHGQALISDGDTTGFVRADLRDPEAVLGAPEVLRRIDFAQPVALLMVAVLHFVRDVDQPYQLVEHYRRHLCPGSFVAISHVENDTNPKGAAHLEAVYGSTSTPGQTRSTADIQQFFTGMDVVDPGVVHVADWRRGIDSGPRSSPAWVVGGVGRIPT